jgi:DNA-binding response OmpR family regulator
MSQILLLEPDKLLAKTYRESLEMDGHLVKVCHSAQTAILSADEVKPNIVVMELQLVSHGGIEFLYEFRSYTDWQSIPIIILTNVPPTEFNDSQQVLQNQLNVDMYLYKPQTSLKKLLQSINDLTYAKIKV